MSAAASEWVLQYAPAVISSKDKIPFFGQKGSPLLAALIYPYADAERLRTCCDFLNILFVIDEVSDRQGRREVQATAATVLNAMKNDAYDDGTVLCRMIKE